MKAFIHSFIKDGVEECLPFTELHATLFVKTVAVLNRRLDDSYVVVVDWLVLQTLPVAELKFILKLVKESWIATQRWVQILNEESR